MGRMRNHPDQLWFDFDKAPTPREEAAKAELRESTRRLVGVMADQSGRPFHEMWVLAYHELYRATGFHAVSSSRGRGKHLDAVEKAGRMQDLHDVVRSMLTAGGFDPPYTVNTSSLGELNPVALNMSTINLSVLTDFDWLQVQQAATGCFSGHLYEWPRLGQAFTRAGITNHPSMMGDAVRDISKLMLMAAGKSEEA